jgi:hypothetical protein
MNMLGDDTHSGTLIFTDSNVIVQNLDYKFEILFSILKPLFSFPLRLRVAATAKQGKGEMENHPFLSGGRLGRG